MAERSKKQENRDEFNTLFQLTLISVLTIMALLLVLVSIYSNWPFWFCPVAGAAIVLCWLAYFLQLGSMDMRVKLYVCTAIVGILYYGSNDVSITDVPVIICLFIIILSAYRNLNLIYLMVSTYPLLILAHIFIIGDIGKDTEQLVFSRLILGGVCLLCAVVISRFFFGELARERQMQEKMEEELKRAKKENERFLANVSHELRTPINAVNGMSEIILQKKLDGELREQVRSIQIAGRRLFGQVSDILDYSELMTGRLKVANDEYEQISAINDAMSSVLWNEMPPKLDFAVDVQTSMPKVLIGDAGKIKKIIKALIENAIKFTESGGGYAYIGTREENYGVNLNIDVWDTGIGMTPEQLQKLYSSFYKVDSGMERRTGGLGLGLAIVHGMVSALGGFMSVESKPVYGTHVHVTIPQHVKNRQMSMAVAEHSEYKIACYFNKEKYVREEIAGYYGRMVNNIRTGLGLEIHQAFSLGELKDILKQNVITHVFIADWEYKMDREYFDALAQKMYVNIFADQNFELPQGSKANVVRKPVYIMSVVNLLSATAPGRAETQTESKLDFSGVRALVVDDDNMNLVVAKGVLKSYGIAADTCLGGSLAIEKCTLEDYQIIFMDHMMPEMNGIEAMQRIRTVRKGHYQNIPIVVLTANAVSGARESFLEAGFDEFLAKPIELLEMSRILKKMLKEGA